MTTRGALLFLPALAACGTLTYYREPPNLTDDSGGATAGDDDDDNVRPPGPDPDTGGPGDTGDLCDAADDCGRPECDSFCDGDGDGAVAEALGGDDCDDGDPDVGPGNIDTCDGKDNDCVGGIDGDSDLDGADVCDDCDDDDPARSPTLAEVCNDGTDQDCDGQDCSGWSDGFEGGSVAGVWSSSGGAFWSTASGSAYAGTYSAASGNIGDSQHSTLTLVATFTGAGTLSFWHTGSSEPNYDYLRFSMDGVELQSQSGTWPWTFATVNVPAGAHTFEWSYSKDGSVSTGLDAVAIDEVVLTNGSP